MLRTAAGGLLTGLSVVFLGVAAPASAAPAAEVAAVDVTVVTANGSGCPNGTATARSLDDTSFAVDSEAYFAWSGVEAPASNARQNCQLALQITPPAGYTYAVRAAEYSGYALLEEGVNGRHQTQYYFQAESQTVTGTHPLTSPYTGGWESADAFEGEDLVFAPCDAQRLLNINTEVAVAAATTGVNWVYLNPGFTVHLVWQPCS